MSANVPSEINAKLTLQPTQSSEGTESANITPEATPSPKENKTRRPLLEPTKSLWKKWNCSIFKLMVPVSGLVLVSVLAIFSPRMLHSITQSRMNRATVTLSSFAIREVVENGMFVDLLLGVHGDRVGSASLLPFSGKLSNKCDDDSCTGSCGVFAEMQVPQVDLGNAEVSIGTFVNLTSKSVFTNFISRSVTEGGNCILITGSTSAKIGPFSTRQLIFHKSLMLSEPLFPTTNESLVTVSSIDMTSMSGNTTFLSADVCIDHHNKITIDSLGPVAIELSRNDEVLGLLTCNNATLHQGSNMLKFVGPFPNNPGEGWQHEFSKLTSDLLNGRATRLNSRGVHSEGANLLLFPAIDNLRLNLTLPTSSQLSDMIDNVSTNHITIHSSGQSLKLSTDFKLSFWSPFNLDSKVHMTNLTLLGDLVISDGQNLGHIAGSVKQKSQFVPFSRISRQRNLFVSYLMSADFEFDGTVENENSENLASLVVGGVTSSSVPLRVINGKLNLSLATPIGHFDLEDLTSVVQLAVPGMNYPNGLKNVEFRFTSVNAAGNWDAELSVEFHQIPFSVYLGFVSFELSQANHTFGNFSSSTPIRLLHSESSILNFTGSIDSRSPVMVNLIQNFVKSESSAIHVRAINARPGLDWLANGLHQISLPLSILPPASLFSAAIETIEIDLGQVLSGEVDVFGVAKISAADPLGQKIPVGMHIQRIDLNVAVDGLGDFCRVVGRFDPNATTIARRRRSASPNKLLGSSIQLGSRDEFLISFLLNGAKCRLESQSTFKRLIERIVAGAETRFSSVGTGLMSIDASPSNFNISLDLNVPIDIGSSAPSTTIESISPSSLAPPVALGLDDQRVIPLKCRLMFSLSDRLSFRMSHPIIRLYHDDSLMAVATSEFFASSNSLASSPNSLASSPNSLASSTNSLASSPNSLASSPNSLASSPNSLASSFDLFIIITPQLPKSLASFISSSHVNVSIQLSTFDLPTADLVGRIPLALSLPDRSTLDVGGLLSAEMFADFKVESVAIKISDFVEVQVTVRVVPIFLDFLSIAESTFDVRVAAALGDRLHEFGDFRMFGTSSEPNVILLSFNVPENDSIESFASKVLTSHNLEPARVFVSGIANVSVAMDQQIFNVQRMNFSHVLDVPTPKSAELVTVKLTNFTFVDASRELGVRFKLMSTISTSLPVSLQFLNSHILTFDVLLTNCPNPVGEASIGSTSTFLKSQFELPIDILIFPVSPDSRLCVENYLHQILNVPGFDPLTSLTFRLRPNSSISSWLARIINSALTSSARLSSSIGVGFGSFVKNVDLSQLEWDMGTGDLSGHLRVQLLSPNLFLGFEDFAARLAIFDDQNNKLAEFRSTIANMSVDVDEMNVAVPIGTFLKLENSLETLGNLLGQDDRQFHVVGVVDIKSIETAIGTFAVVNRTIDSVVPIPINILFPKIFTKFSVDRLDVPTNSSLPCGGALARDVRSVSIFINLEKFPKLLTSDLSFYILVNNHKIGTLTGNPGNSFVVSLPVPTAASSCEALRSLANEILGTSNGSILDLVPFGTQSQIDSIRHFPIAKLRNLFDFDLMKVLQVEQVGAQLRQSVNLFFSVFVDFPIEIEIVSIELAISQNHKIIARIPSQQIRPIRRDKFWDFQNLELKVLSSIAQILADDLSLEFSGTGGAVVDTPLGSFDLRDVPIHSSVEYPTPRPSIELAAIKFFEMATGTSLPFEAKLSISKFAVPTRFWVSTSAKFALLVGDIPLAEFRLKHSTVGLRANENAEIHISGSLLTFDSKLGREISELVRNPKNLNLSVVSSDLPWLGTLTGVSDNSIASSLQIFGDAEIASSALALKSGKLFVTAAGSVPIIDFGPSFSAEVQSFACRLSVFHDDRLLGTIVSSKIQILPRRKSLEFAVADEEIVSSGDLPAFLVDVVRSNVDSTTLRIRATIESLAVATSLGPIVVGRVAVPDQSIAINVPKLQNIEIFEMHVTDGGDSLVEVRGTTQIQISSPVDLALGDVSLDVVAGDGRRVGLIDLLGLRIGPNQTTSFQFHLDNDDWMSQVANLMISNQYRSNLTSLSFIARRDSPWPAQLVAGVGAVVDIRRLLGDEFDLELSQKSLDASSSESIRFSTNFKIANFPPPLLSEVSHHFDVARLVARVVSSDDSYIGDISSEFDIFGSSISADLIVGKGFAKFIQNVVSQPGSTKIRILGVAAISGHLTKSEIPIYGNFQFDMSEEISHLSTSGPMVKFGDLRILRGTPTSLTLRDEQSQINSNLSWDLKLGQVDFEMTDVDHNSIGTCTMSPSLISANLPPRATTTQAVINQNFDGLLSSLINKKSPALVLLRFASYPANRIVQTSLEGWTLPVTIPSNVARIQPAVRVIRSELSRFGASRVFAKISLDNELPVAISLLGVDIQASPIRDRKTFSKISVSWDTNPQIFERESVSDTAEFSFEAPWNFLLRVGLVSLFAESFVWVTGTLRLLIDEFPATVTLNIEMPIAL